MAWEGPAASKGQSVGSQNLPPASCAVPRCFLLLICCVLMGGCPEGLICIPNTPHTARHSVSINSYLRNK